jgi:hypothetical protein
MRRKSRPREMRTRIAKLISFHMELFAALDLVDRGRTRRDCTCAIVRSSPFGSVPCFRQSDETVRSRLIRFVTGTGTAKIAARSRYWLACPLAAGGVAGRDRALARAAAATGEASASRSHRGARPRPAHRRLGRVLGVGGRARQRRRGGHRRHCALAGANDRPAGLVAGAGPFRRVGQERHRASVAFALSGAGRPFARCVRRERRHGPSFAVGFCRRSRGADTGRTRANRPTGSSDRRRSPTELISRPSLPAARRARAAGARAPGGGRAIEPAIAAPCGATISAAARPQRVRPRRLSSKCAGTRHLGRADRGAGIAVAC